MPENEVEALLRLVVKWGVDNVWDTESLWENFDVHSFRVPMVFVTRKCDSRPGIMMFQDSPRFYYNFKPKWMPGD